MICKTIVLNISEFSKSPESSKPPREMDFFEETRISSPGFDNQGNKNKV